MEAGASRIELTSYTKKDTTADESGEQKSIQAEDILDDKSEPTIDHTEMGQDLSAIKEVSEYFIHQMGKIWGYILHEQ